MGFFIYSPGSGETLAYHCELYTSPSELDSPTFLFPLINIGIEWRENGAFGQFYEKRDCSFYCNTL
jgi:hypothetical protein